MLADRTTKRARLCMQPSGRRGPTQRPKAASTETLHAAPGVKPGKPVRFVSSSASFPSGSEQVGKERSHGKRTGHPGHASGNDGRKKGQARCSCKTNSQPLRVMGPPEEAPLLGRFTGSLQARRSGRRRASVEVSVPFLIRSEIQYALLHQRRSMVRNDAGLG